MAGTKIMRDRWIEHIPKIKELGLLGWRMPAIGKYFGVSRQRIKQIISKHIPEWSTEYGSAVIKKNREQKYFNKWGHKQSTDLYSSQRSKFYAKKANAVRSGYEWNLDFGQIEWPQYCPILGIKLDYFSESRKENSPSFDRRDNSIGYVNGNVLIVSWRANRIKNDGTAEEHRRIADFLDNQQ